MECAYLTGCRTPTGMTKRSSLLRTRKTWRMSGSGFQNSSGSLKVRLKSKIEDNSGCDSGARNPSPPLSLAGKESGVVVKIPGDRFDGCDPGNSSKTFFPRSLVLKAGVGVTVKRRVPCKRGSETLSAPKVLLCFMLSVSPRL